MTPPLDYSDIAEPAPLQYSTGDDCKECGRPLSRYNPYVVCGPCRVRIAADVVDDFEEDDVPDILGAPVISYTWERFKRRTPVASRLG